MSDVLLKDLINIPTDFTDLYRTLGFYSDAETRTGMYHKFSRYSHLDAENALIGTREYLFFTKPDLHIMKGTSGKLNPELANDPFFIELLDLYPEIPKQLQLSAGNKKEPFMNLLSWSVKSNLDLPSITATTIDNPSTIFGNSYDYRGSGESADDNPQFTLEFTDNKFLETYILFKAYEEYQVKKSHGLVSPPDFQKYVVNKVLHDQIGIFKFLCDESDYIVHYSYIWGAMPLDVPRDVFSNNNFDGGISFSVGWKGAFIEDMNPLIIRDFNDLTGGNTGSELPTWNMQYDRPDAQLASMPFIVKEKFKHTKRYKMKWR